MLQIHNIYFKTTQLLILLTAVCSIAACGSDAGGNKATAAAAAVRVAGNDNRTDHPIMNAVDGDSSTFMTTNTLTVGDVRWAAFQLPTIRNLSQINFRDDYTNDYNLGDLEVFVSSDSTDGVDGQWRLAGTINPTSHNFVDGEGSIQINESNVAWVKLAMKYNGVGAFGGTPAFYLSEITFH